jgi:hypothetical protein
VTNLPLLARSEMKIDDILDEITNKQVIHRIKILK